MKTIKRNRFTKAGYQKLKQEYEQLLKERPLTVEDLKKAREMGDLKENGYYKASRAKLSAIDSRLSFLSYNLKTAKIIDDVSSGIVGIGSTVILSNAQKEITFQIVGDLEANPGDGKLSLLSPIGRAIEGKKEGAVVEIHTPSGAVTYSVKKVN